MTGPTNGPRDASRARAVQDVLDRHVGEGAAAGAVALLARGPDVQVLTAGGLSVDGSPMHRDTIFRIASITKPITAAAVLMLVEQGLIGLDDPVSAWLPEIASPKAVPRPDAPVEDAVAVRPPTVRELLTSCPGWGFPSEFDGPAVQALFQVQADGREIQVPPPPDEWLAALARVPMVTAPGEAFLYNTASDLQGVLVARVSGQTLPDFLAERIFVPLGMHDTAFTVPADKRARFASYYRRDDAGALVLADGPDGLWSTMPAFPSGAGGLVSTVDDWLAFGRMLLAGGDGLLSPATVRQMTTNQLTPAQRRPGELFLQGQSWGFGGAVDLAADPAQPWLVPGRYGWVGGTGTSAYVVPDQDTVTLLFTQVMAEGPQTGALLEDFWTAAA